jgi:hypothetical protein
VAQSNLPSQVNRNNQFSQNSLPNLLSRVSRSSLLNQANRHNRNSLLNHPSHSSQAIPICKISFP